MLKSGSYLTIYKTTIKAQQQNRATEPLNRGTTCDDKGFAFSGGESLKDISFKLGFVPFGPSGPKSGRAGHGAIP
jgi:hypothetical protein